MRVTQSMLNRNVTYWISRNLEELARANEQLSTGQRLNTISDDVLASGRVLRLERENEAIQSYVRNLDLADTMLSFATTSLEQTSETIARVKELAIQAATETYNDSNLQTIAAGVDASLVTLVALGNIEYQGTYAFSGEAVHTASFATTKDAAGEIQSVAYEGAMLTTQVNVGPRAVTEVNVVGQEIFQGDGDLFQTVIDLREGIRAGDQDEINRLIGELDVSHTDIRQALGTLGERQDQLQVLANASEAFLQRNDEVIANLRDADVAELAVQYNSLMASLEVVMKVAAETVKPSIFDFL